MKSATLRKRSQGKGRGHGREFHLPTARACVGSRRSGDEDVTAKCGSLGLHEPGCEEGAGTSVRASARPYITCFGRITTQKVPNHHPKEDWVWEVISALIRQDVRYKRLTRSQLCRGRRPRPREGFGNLAGETGPLPVSLRAGRPRRHGLGLCNMHRFTTKESILHTKKERIKYMYICI